MKYQGKVSSTVQLLVAVTSSFQSFLGVLVFPKIVFSKRFLIYAICSTVLSIPVVSGYYNGASHYSIVLFFKVFLFGSVFFYALKFFDYIEIRKKFILAVNCMQLISLIDYFSGGLIFGNLFPDGNIYNGRFGGFFEFDVGNYGLWSTFALFASYLHFKKFNFFVLINLVCCVLSGTRWPMLIMAIFLFNQLILSRRQLFVVIFGALVVLLIGGDRSIATLLIDVGTGDSLTLYEWFLITGPAFQQFIDKGNILFGVDINALYESIDAPVKYAHDSSFSILFAIGFAGTLGFLILFRFVLGMSLIMLFIMLIIGLKGLYIFNVYSALFLGFLQVVVLNNKYSK
jgi:hypothetical protein